jgi:hypothetical protein
MNKHPTAGSKGAKHGAPHGHSGGRSEHRKVDAPTPAKTKPLVSAAPQPTWTRYADSRLKQFCLR